MSITEWVLNICLREKGMKGGRKGETVSSFDRRRELRQNFSSSFYDKDVKRLYFKKLNDF